MLRRDTRQALKRGRTGDAFRFGYAPTDPEMMVQEIIRTRGVMDAVDAFDEMVTDFAVVAPTGRYFGSRAQAVNFTRTEQGERLAATAMDDQPRG